MIEHKKTIMPLNGEDVEIDTSLVHLIEALNDYGIKTTHCCEGQARGYVSIDLANVEVYFGLVNGKRKTMFNLRFPTPKKDSE